MNHEEEKEEKYSLTTEYLPADTFGTCFGLEFTLFKLQEANRLEVIWKHQADTGSGSIFPRDRYP